MHCTHASTRYCCIVRRHLGEVADEVAAELVVGGEHVEEERLDIVVQRLVVEKQFGEKTQVLAVDLVGVAIHLEHGEVVSAVDFVGRWMEQAALLLQQNTRSKLRIAPNFAKYCI